MAVRRDDLIFNRNMQDIYEAYNSIDSNEDKKGCYNASDLNRVCDMIDKIITIINGRTGLVIPKLNKFYTETSKMTYDEFNTIIDKIYYVIRTYNSWLHPTIPIEFNIRRDGIFTYKEANLIEKTLYNICVGLNIN